MNDIEDLSGAQTEAEDILLGAIIIESSRGTNEAIRQVMNIVKPEDFRGCVVTEPPWRWTRRARIFFAMTKCEHPPHEINLAYKLAELNMLQNQDCAYFKYCCFLVPCSLDYMDYARTVKDYSVKRQAQELVKRGDMKGLQRLTKSELKPLGTVPL